VGGGPPAGGPGGAGTIGTIGTVALPVTSAPAGSSIPGTRAPTRLR
jgi:hypothetical protein